MTYQSADKVARNIQSHSAGLRLAKEARDRGEYALAWTHAQTYGLNALDLLELDLPNNHRPKGFNPGVPKAMGCV
jgi:hypothetical protein